MPLALLLHALRAAQTLHRCERLATGPGYVFVPALGPFRCPAPCGRECPFRVALAAVVAPARTDEARAALRLHQAQAGLVAGALAQPGAFGQVEGPDPTRELVLGAWHRN